MLIRFLVALICFGFLSGAANAVTPPVTLSGHFNDSANTALVGSDLGPALFGNDFDIANNVALYSLSVPIASDVKFESKGYIAGGADPYFTLFQGSGNSATFLQSNYTQAFSTGGDFSLTYNLAAGGYMVAMGVFANTSLAENYGVGTLGDGFTSLGVPGSLGNYYYELGITQQDHAVPEPSTFLLIGSGLVGLAGIRKRSGSRDGWAGRCGRF